MIIVLREHTERIEVVEEGIGVLVGTNKEKILAHFQKMIGNDHNPLRKQSGDRNIYGSPGVSKNILNKIKEANFKCR